MIPFRPIIHYVIWDQKKDTVQPVSVCYNYDIPLTCNCTDQSPPAEALLLVQTQQGCSD